MTRSIERRDFLAELGALAYLTTGAPNVWRISSTARIQSDPFTLGVASGDPTATGAVIWTRLAPQPLEPDGGMSGQRINVDWQVAEDEQFGRIVQRGRVAAVPELGFSLHVDVSGLQGDRWYCYRFMIGNGASPVGRLRTAPAAGAQAAMTMAFVSCQHWEQGLYTAYDHLSKEDRLDLVAHLGDYIYEYGPIEGRTRRYASTEVRTLDQYRARYAQTKSDAFLRAAHARAPWIVTWDDHEVDNNYANLVGENVMESEEQMRLRRAAGYQAWWEHMPVRVPRARNWADLNITKRLDWGALASFHVLDTRQYRSDQPCADGIKDTPCGEWGNAAHTLLGAEQERWLDAGLSGSPAGWQVLAQQIRVAPYDEKPGAGERYSMDQWSGYPAAIGRL
ncbi:MAG: alkaline phosphatase, partial [Gemmatimonadetes bacterium]|nr:alkaline phosphatase [Gemmatimonadota bacterium]